MSELSALAGSEGYGACDDEDADGTFHLQACCGKCLVVRQKTDEEAKNRSEAA